jgi:hypothetical protein
MDSEIPNLKGKRVYVSGVFKGWTHTSVRLAIKRVGGICFTQPAKKDDYSVYGETRDEFLQPKFYPNKPKTMTLRQVLMAIEKTKREEGV